MFTSVPISSVPTLDRPVTDVMHAGCIAVPAAAPLALAARAMEQHGTHAVLAQGEDGPLGWVTSRGVLHNHPRQWNDATAGDAITEAIASVPSTATVQDAVTALLAAGSSHVLVQNPGSRVPAGVVSETDLVVLLARESAA
jgi:signal-transduction protein with cAMP-binding, CBS, and nucleotidyltransferase domain